MVNFMPIYLWIQRYTPSLFGFVSFFYTPMFFVLTLAFTFLHPEQGTAQTKEQTSSTEQGAQKLQDATPSEEAPAQPAKSQEAKPEEKVVETAPSDSTLALRKGISLVLEGKYDEALIALGEAAALDPQRLDVHDAIGNTHQLKGDMTAAQGAYKTLLDKANVQQHVAYTLRALFGIATTTEILQGPGTQTEQAWKAVEDYAKEHDELFEPEWATMRIEASKQVASLESQFVEVRKRIEQRTKLMKKELKDKNKKGKKRRR